MVWIDIVFLAPILWGVYSGFKKGLIAQVIGLISLVCGVWIGTHFQHIVQPLLVDKVQEKYLSILCFVVLFFSILIIGAIISKILEKFINFIQLKLLNKVGGILLGVFKIISFLVIIVFIIESFDRQSMLIARDTKNNSYCYPVLKNIGELVVPNLNHEKLLDNLPNENKGTI
jgi:membrane protein required for colicin V production